mgnify:CR=1 FL=1
MPERIFIDRPLPPGFDELFGPDWEVVGPNDAELPTCRAAIAGASPWPAERIAKGAMLEVISRSGIGFDTVDLDAAAAFAAAIAFFSAATFACAAATSFDGGLLAAGDVRRRPVRVGVALDHHPVPALVLGPV